MRIRALLPAAVILGLAIGLAAHAAHAAGREAATATDTEELKPIDPAATQPQPNERQPARKPTITRERPKAEATEGTVIKPGKPDLVVEVAKPTADGEPAIATVRNVGSGAGTYPITMFSQIEGRCEVGKLKSSIAAAIDGPQTLQPIPAGSFRRVGVQPASLNWEGNGCYYHVTVRAESWEDTNATNNQGTAHFCMTPSGCY